MIDWIKNTMDAMGYPGIALLMFLENVFPPVPSELIMPLAGFTASQGKLTLWGVILAGMIGSVIGQLPLYYLGKIVGQERLRAWAEKYGKWLTVSGEDIDGAKDWFDRHGRKAVLFGRLVPGLRSLLSVPAGFANMNLPLFLLFSAIGTGLWAAILGYLGSMLGRNYEKVSQYVGPAAYLILGALVLAMIVRAVKRKRASDATPEGA